MEKIKNALVNFSCYLFIGGFVIFILYMNFGRPIVSLYQNYQSKKAIENHVTEERQARKNHTKDIYEIDLETDFYEVSAYFDDPESISKIEAQNALEEIQYFFRIYFDWE